jgi:N-acetylglucosaminyldiphosphoundecaprenol N-acetyl-beta-D-mannosaminyltransferase
MESLNALEPEVAASPTLLELASTCFVGDLGSAADALVERAAAGGGGYVCLCNVHVLTMALHDPALARAVHQAAIRFPDGEPVAWLLRRTGSPGAQRIGGPDLFPLVVDRGRRAALRHLLVGSTESTLERLARVIDERYPGAEIDGIHPLPFAQAPEVEGALVERVQSAGVNVVWVALGAPKQELWMSRAAPLMPDTVFVGVGAAFDFLAGDKRRAPSAMQRAGLEWLHRLASEPRRLTGRYLRSNSEFMARTGVELVRHHVRDGRR